MHDLSATESGRRDEMIDQWERWATKNGVAFPKRFNMYQFLKEKRKQSK